MDEMIGEGGVTAPPSPDLPARGDKSPQAGTQATVRSVLDPDLAYELREARDRIEGAKQDRDQLIVAAIEQGASLREVAAEVGLTHAGVADVLRRRRR